MRSTTLKTSSALALMAIAVLGLGQVAAAQGASKIVGSWQVQITQVDCTSGTPLGPPFTSLVAFARGGMVAEDTSNPGFGRGQRGPGQGTWTYSGSSAYAAQSVALIKYTTPPNAKTHNPGFNAGQQAITQNVTYNAASDTWSSKATVEFSDGSGVYRQGCAEATAKRL